MTKATGSQEQSAAAPLSYHDAMQILRIVKSTQNCASIRLKFADTTISLERESPAAPVVHDDCANLSPTPTTGGADRHSANRCGASQYADLRAPMVGFFQHLDGADGTALKIGSQVRATDAIGMIRAQQFSEPMLAATSGELVALLVEDGGFVEYGQIVARVKLAD